MLKVATNPTYQHLPLENISAQGFKLLGLAQDDMIPIMHWRNNQIDVLRQAEKLTFDKQKAYYQKIIEPCFSQKEPNQILFGIWENDNMVGYGGLVHIDWQSQRAEISFLVDPELAKNKETYKRIFLGFLENIKTVAFERLELNRLFTETYDIRDFHISIIEQSGFREEGRLIEHVKIDNNMVDSIFHGYLRREFNELSK